MRNWLVRLEIASRSIGTEVEAGRRKLGPVAVVSIGFFPSPRLSSNCQICVWMLFVCFCFQASAERVVGSESEKTIEQCPKRISVKKIKDKANCELTSCLSV